MTPENRKLLGAIVRAAIVATNDTFVERTILAAHNGKLRAFVTQGNLYLFRQYRNSVSSSPREMIREALRDGHEQGCEVPAQIRLYGHARKCRCVIE
jgi:hypothetical protein